MLKYINNFVSLKILLILKNQIKFKNRVRLSSGKKELSLISIYHHTEWWYMLINARDWLARRWLAKCYLAPSTWRRMKVTSCSASRSVSAGKTFHFTRRLHSSRQEGQQVFDGKFVCVWVLKFKANISIQRLVYENWRKATYMQCNKWNLRRFVAQF